MTTATTTAASSTASATRFSPDTVIVVDHDGARSLPQGCWELSARVPASLAEAAADILATLGDGAAAIELPFTQANPEDAPQLQSDGLAMVRVYSAAAVREGASERDALRRRANRALRPFHTRARVRYVRDADWVEACKASFPAQRIGRRLLVRPPWSDEPGRPDDVVIEMEPGIAFGTGDHPTTRACLEAAERLVRPGARVLDLGCGSGILSIAAVKLGAATVWALDIDPFAVDAARANVERNGLGARIEVGEGSLGPLTPPGLPVSFDLVLANIASAPLIELAPAIARALAPTGVAVASGVIDERADAVTAAFGAAGLRVRETVAEGDWRTFVAERANA